MADTEELGGLVDAAVVGQPLAQARLVEALAARWPGAEHRAVFDDAVDGLARHAGAGNQEALGLLGHVIVRTGLAMGPIRLVLSDDAAAEDALGETLLVVARKVSSWRGDSRFRVWLYTVARREALAVARARAREEPEAEPAEDPGRWVATASSMLASRDAVGRVIDQLPPQLAQPLRLREFEDLSYEQIAERMGITVGAVKLRLHRARRQAAGPLLAALRERDPAAGADGAEP